MPILQPSKQLFGSGMNKTLGFMISDDFCFKAKKDGKVSKIDLKNNIAILDYSDGSQDALDLSDKLDKNSNMGFYIHQKFMMVYKEGESFKKGDVLAYSPSYFKGKGKNIDFCPGALAKVAIASGDFAYEDSTLISETLCDKCAANINMQKQIALGKNAIIHKIVNIGDTVITGDHLLDFTQSFNDAETTEFLNILASKLDSEDLESITHETVKAKYTGKITNIEVYYNCEFDELNPSIQDLINKYQIINAQRRRALGDIKADNVHIPPIEKVNSSKIGKAEFPMDGGIIINIWIEYLDKLGKGDKITYSTALKGVVSRICTKQEAPISTYRSEEPIEAILTPTGIISRMTSDIYSMLFR